MSGQRLYWQGISETTAVLWTETVGIDASDRAVSMWIGPSSLVMYQPVKFEALRDIPLARMDPERAGFPQFTQEHPPTAAALAAAWRSSKAERDRAERVAGRAPDMSAREPGETVEHFYQRVAHYYRREQARSGKPTKAIADSANVPKSTAARWVREARARGFLTDSPKRGQARA